MVGAAIVAAMISTFSFGWGQAIWPVGLLMLLAQKQAKRPIIVWALSALIAYGAYYYHFTRSGPPALAFLEEPMNALSYLLVMFGRPFTYDLYPAMFLGAIMLLLLIPVACLIWERRDKLNLQLPWLGLMLFALGGAVMILLGRLAGVPGMPTPLTDAMQPRYTAMPILYLIGLSGFALSVADRLKLSQKLIKYLVLVILIVQIPLVYSSYYVGSITSKERYTLMKKLHDCSDQPIERVSKDCLSANNYRNSYETAMEQLKYLKSKHWGGY